MTGQTLGHQTLGVAQSAIRVRFKEVIVLLDSKVLALPLSLNTRSAKASFLTLVEPATGTLPVLYSLILLLLVNSR